MQSDLWRNNRTSGWIFLSLMAIGMVNHRGIAAAELSENDFRFTGPLGSQGASIERLGTNHFRVTLGAAPEHPDWCNNLQFEITKNALGNALRLDVVFHGGGAYRFNEYFHSFSYNGKQWYPVFWTTNAADSSQGDTLYFPPFREDRVLCGLQVPMSYEDVVTKVKSLESDPDVKVVILGESLGKRNITRVTITGKDSPHPMNRRWVHYFANQHPGEHNSQWRMVGAIDWLLSSEGYECRQRSISHFVLMTSPDAPSHGWYRVNAQGVDMNRSYRVEGSDPKTQAHEAAIVQADVERCMKSDTPITDIWSMHTWGGIVEPICMPGPEMGTTVGPWTDLRDAIERFDRNNLVEPLAVPEKMNENTTYWTTGPHTQFYGITAVLCEGGGDLYTKEENLESGEVLMKGLATYYKGILPEE